MFREELLTLMERKDHWAWSYFSGPTVSRDHLRIHFQQEWAVYVRDFPVFLSRIHGMNPPLDVREALAENIYEEDTGRLSIGRSHPRLFLEMMEGLGFNQGDFSAPEMLPESAAYRTWLDDTSRNSDWQLAAAIFTVFVEGSVKDRDALRSGSSPRIRSAVEDIVTRHPLVRYHAVPPANMDLVRAHHLVEAGHRHAAYDMLVNHVGERSAQTRILAGLKQTLDLWLQYRDGIAAACGLSRL